MERDHNMSEMENALSAPPWSSGDDRVDRDARHCSLRRHVSLRHALAALFAVTMGASAWMLLLSDDAPKGARDEERSSVVTDGDESLGTDLHHEYDSTEIDPDWYPSGNFEGSGCSIDKADRAATRMDKDSAASHSIAANISFADLAAVMIPPWFEETIDLCLSTIVPAIPPADTDETLINRTELTTSVMPGDVCLLRKTILKTRDLLDAFCPVYPNSSSLADYLHRDDDEEPRNSGSNDSKDAADYDNARKIAHNEATRLSFDKNKTAEEAEDMDIWGALHHQLISGYELLGDFQDLDHANITYTPDQLADYQRQLWTWREGFVSLVEEQGRYIQLFLSTPCMTNNDDEGRCRNVHNRSSHLFWGNVTGDALPDGRADRASSALGRLGSAQLGRAVTYLTQSLAYERVINPVVGPGDNVTLDDDAHFYYHNFRKELRSFMDGAILFGNLLLPGSTVIPEIKTSGVKKVCRKHFLVDVPLASGVNLQADQAICSLDRARKILGDLNDDYVAYSTYFEWKEYPEKQSKLKKSVESQWSHFRGWVGDSGLLEKIDFLRDRMDSGKSFGEEMTNGVLVEKA